MSAADSATIKRLAPIVAADGKVLLPETFAVTDTIAGTTYATHPTLAEASAWLTKQRRNGTLPSYIHTR